MKNLVEDSLTIDIRDFTKSKWFYPGAIGALRWHQGQMETGCALWRLNGDAVRLTVQEKRSDIVWEQDIRLGRTRTRLGERIWLLCPDCRANAMKLHCPRRRQHFACRRCHDLLYQSQVDGYSKMDWALAKVRTLGRELAVAGPRKRRQIRWELETLQRGLRGPAPADCEATGQSPDEASAQEEPGRECGCGTREPAVREEPGHAPRRSGRPRAKRAYTRRVPRNLTPRQSEREAFCPRCRDRRELNNIQPTTLSNGRPAIRGTCSVCSCPTSRIVAAAAGSTRG
jgi:hypothetical protein